MQRFLLTVPLGLSLLLLTAAPASAQISQRSRTPSAARAGTPPADPIVSKVDGASYRVEFDPDAIDATLEDGTIPRIVVRPVKGFGQLARPRVEFVRELLKSVEVM